MARTRLALAAALILTPAAFAQPSPESDSAVVDSLLACSALQDDTARLACQDTALADFSAALDTGRLAVVERSVVREVERESFGLSMPRIAELGGLFRRSDSDADDGTPEEEVMADGSVAVLNAAGGIEELRGLGVDRVTVGRDDMLTVHLENGQVWRQTSNRNVRPPRRDDMDDLTASIERGALSSHFLELSHNGRRFRVERID
ncbi:MAG: hypothetical protein ACLFQ5_07375 [Oceanicaulis sp.]